MPSKPTAASLLEKFAAEEAELQERVDALNAELAPLAARLDEVRVIRQALETTSDAPKRAAAAPKKAATKQPAPKAEAASATKKPAAPKKASTKKAGAKKAAPKKAGRKGRRKSTAKGVHALGIVDAAFALAKEKGVAEADAGLVLEWFAEAGYKTRGGTPNRNSVYVSLNRAASQGVEKGDTRITRPSRGKFVFDLNAG